MNPKTRRRRFSVTNTGSNYGFVERRQIGKHVVRDRVPRDPAACLLDHLFQPLINPASLLERKSGSHQEALRCANPPRPGSQRSGRALANLHPEPGSRRCVRGSSTQPLKHGSGCFASENHKRPAVRKSVRCPRSATHGSVRRSNHPALRRSRGQ